MPPTIPAPWQSFLDDAATFPPGDAPLAEALDAHRSHRLSSYAGLIGTFVARDTDLPTVADAAVGPIALLVTGGAGAIAGPLGLAERRGVEIAAVEIALRDLDDLPGNARRVVAALDQARAEGTLAEEVPAYVELPGDRGPRPSYGWLAAADELAAAELRLKLRTGGVEADAFPTPEALAGWIDAALERETPFKCTAGLHHAVRHHDAATGAAQHGFLNVLLATRAAFDGADADEVTGLLDETEADELLARFHGHDVETLTRTRRWFTSVGTCSIAEPLEDLVTLGLVAPEEATGETDDVGGPA